MNKPIDTTNGNAEGSPDRADSRADRTPRTDMQGEDAGTASSGSEAVGSNANSASNAQPADGRSAESAMKQTSKTDSERRGG